MLHELLKSLRERSGLKKAAIALLLGVERGTVYSWEDGRKRPSPGNLRALADAYGASEAERDDLARLAAFGPDAPVAPLR